MMKKQRDSFLQSRTIADSEMGNGMLMGFLLFLVGAIWFLPLLQKGALMGDDLSLPLYIKGMTLKEAIIPADATKYRPFLSLFLLAVSRIISGKYYEFFFINLMIHWVNSLMVYRICHSIGRNKLSSFLIACLFISSQFSYYNVIQGLGMMEGLALFFVLCGLFFGVRYSRENGFKDFALAVLFSFLACFTHERYITLSVVCVMLALLSLEINLKKRLIRAAIGLIPMVSNWFVKSVLFRAEFMTGTDGRSISLGIGPVIGFFYQGLCDIFGINNGPDYLNGYIFSRYTSLQKAMAISATILLLAGTLYCMIQAILEKEDKCRKLRRFILFCALAGGTLIGGCVTIRLELRWVLTPYAVFLAFLAYVCTVMKDQRVATGWIVLIALLTIPVNYAYSQNLDNVFFVRSMAIAQETYKGTILKYGEALADSEVYVVSNDEMDWAVGMQPWQPVSLFDSYLDRKVTFHSIRSIDEIDTENDNVKVFSLNGDLTVSEQPYDSQHETILDFTKEEPLDTYPDAAAGTPTGEGVLVYNDALTVLSGYGVSYGITDISEGTEFLLSASIPFAESDGAEVVVYLQSEESRDVIYQGDVYPDQPIVHELVQIDGSMDWAELSVEVYSPTGDASLDWVALEECGLVREKG